MKELNINKTHTALVVIDLQKGIVARDTVPYSASEVITNAKKLKEAFNKNNMTVFLVRVTPSPDGKDGLKPLNDSGWSMPKEMPADWAEIVPELKEGGEYFVITKRQWGAFYGTELDLELRRRGIDTIVLCGISTNIGVESTARFAYEYGYNQIFAEDAMASGASVEEHEASVKFVFPRIGRIRKTKEILEDLE